MTIAEWLKLARADLDMTQAEASEAMGVSVETYRRWECGTNRPGKNGFEKIAAYYDTTVSELHGLET